MTTLLLACGESDGGGGQGSQQAPQIVAGAAAPAPAMPATPTTGTPATPPATPTEGAAFHNVECSPEVGGVCQNPTDCPAVRDGSAREIASNCGPACLGDPDEDACAANCIIQQAALTQPCTDCYVQIVVCSQELCLPPCLMDPESQACFDCQLANGCRAAFDQCSGLPPVGAPGGSL